LVLERIKKINADVLVLTETSNAINLESDYYAVKSVPFERNPTEQWTTIWSKWRIKSRIKTFDDKRTACALIDSPFGDLIVYGTIFPYHMAGVRGNRYAFSGYKAWELHVEDIFRQSEDWRRIKAKYSSTTFFVIGDFNQTRDGLPKGYGTKTGRAVLTKQLKENGLSCVTEIDFAKTKQLNLDIKKKKIRRNIDHICVSSEWLNTLNQYSIGAWDHFNEEGYYLSDHNGVFMDFDFK